MISKLALFKAISLAAKKEQREHRVVILGDIENDLLSLKPVAQNLEPSQAIAYTHQINVLEEIIKKKKEDLSKDP